MTLFGFLTNMQQPTGMFLIALLGLFHAGGNHPSTCLVKNTVAVVGSAIKFVSLLQTSFYGKKF